jgi:hypothetical protein
MRLEKKYLGYESGIHKGAIHERIHIGAIHEKKLEAKNLVLLFLSGKFLVSIETDDSNNIFG